MVTGISGAPARLEVEHDVLARAADLLERDLDLPGEEDRIGDVPAVEGPAAAALPGRDRRALEAVDIGALAPGGADIILGAGADQGGVLAVAVEDTS